MNAKRIPTEKVSTVYGTATHFADADGVFCGAHAALNLDDDDLEFVSCTKCMKTAGFEPFVFEPANNEPIVIRLFK